MKLVYLWQNFVQLLLAGMPTSFFHIPEIPRAVAKTRDIHRAVGYFVVVLAVCLVLGSVLAMWLPGAAPWVLAYLLAAFTLDRTAYQVVRPWINTPRAQGNAAAALNLGLTWPWSYPQLLTDLRSNPIP